MLLVDDRPENLLAFEATLEPLGVRLVRANNAAEALEHVLNDEFAVIVLDVQMPGMDGYEVARHIKAMAPPRLTPIIFVTALDSDRRQVHAGYASGAVDYLFKPLDPDVLRQKVAAFIRLFEEKEAEARRQRKRYADLTEAAAHRAAALLERISDAYIAMDRNFTIESVNAATERTLGRKRASLVGQIYWNVLPEGSRAEMVVQLGRVHRDHVAVHFTHRFAGSDGRAPSSRWTPTRPRRAASRSSRATSPSACAPSLRCARASLGTARSSSRSTRGSASSRCCSTTAARRWTTSSSRRTRRS